MGRIIMGSINSNTRIETRLKPLVQECPVVTKSIEYIDRPVNIITEVEKIIEVPVEVEKLVYIKQDLSDIEKEISDLSKDLAQNQLHNYETLSKMEEVLNSQGRVIVELREQSNKMEEEQKKIIQEIIEKKEQQDKRQKVLYIVLGICFIINVLINFIT